MVPDHPENVRADAAAVARIELLICAVIAPPDRSNEIGLAARRGKFARRCKLGHAQRHCHGLSVSLSERCIWDQMRSSSELYRLFDNCLAISCARSAQKNRKKRRVSVKMLSPSG